MSASTVVGNESQPRNYNTCMWCGGGGLSKEHILPQWLGKLVATTETSRRSAIRDPITLDESKEWSRQGSVFTVQPRIVCRTCNGGWMSALENQAIPILTPIVQGVPTHLGPDSLSTIASWAVKTALVAQHAYMPVTTVEQRRQFMTDRRPLPRTRIWLGRFAEPKLGNVWTCAWKWHRNARAQRVVEQTPDNSYFTVLAAGNLLLVVTASPDPHYGTLTSPPSTRTTLALIWPIQDDVSWPPLFATSEDEVIILRQKIMEMLGRRRGLALRRAYS